MTNWGYFGPRTSHPRMHEELWNRTSGEVGVDIETVSLDDRRPLCIAIATTRDEAFYYPIDSPFLPWHILKNPTITKVFHNGHFDLGVLDAYRGVSVENVQDTIIAAQLLGLPPALATLAFSLFGTQWKSITDLLGPKGKDQKTMDELPEEDVAIKCAYDARYTLAIWQTVKSAIPRAAFDLEMRLMPVLMAIERRGMRVDIERLKKHKERVEKEVSYYRNTARGFGFNPGSSPQLAAVLESRGWRIKYNNRTGKPILNKQMLSTIYAKDPLAHLTTLYRGNNILLTTFINPILERHLRGDRVYSRVNQIIARSGRLSRSNPNTQNIPELMRDIYIASEGCYLESRDLSQIELRVLAWIVWQVTGDRTMQRLFEADINIHKGVQAMLNILDYRIAKNLNFAVTYGGDEQTLNERTGIPLDVARQHIANYWAAFPGVKSYVDMIHAHIEREGYVRTMLGRERKLPGFDGPEEWRIKKAKREGFNTIIQGSATELLKEWEVRCEHHPQINTVHDEILNDVPAGTSLSTGEHINLAEYETPIETKRGMNWLEITPV